MSQIGGGTIGKGVAAVIAAIIAILTGKKISGNKSNNKPEMS